MSDFILDVAVQVNAKKLSDGSDAVFYFSNTSFTANITDNLTSPDYFYEPLLTDGVILNTLSQGDAGFSVRLSNNERLNYLAEYGFSGEIIDIYYRTTINGLVSDWALTERAYIDSLVIKKRIVEIKLQSAFNLLKKEMVTAIFIGNPALYAGEPDISGQLKPRLFGDVFNVKPITLNKNQLIYGFNWDKIGDFSSVINFAAVRDGGVELTGGADFADTVSMDASDPAPGAGEYYTCLADATIKLGSSPVFDITADVQQGDNDLDHFLALLVAETDLVDTINGATAEQKDYTLGWVIDRSITYSDMIKQLTEHMDLLLTINNSSRLTLTAIDINAPARDVQFVESGMGFDLLDGVVYHSIEHDNVTLPIKYLNLKYGHNYFVQQAAQIAGSVSDADKSRYALADSRYVRMTMCTHQQTVDATVDIMTHLVGLLDPSQEAVRWTAQRGFIIDSYTLKCPINTNSAPLLLGVAHDDIDTAAVLKLGDVLQLKSTTFGIDNDRCLIRDININTKSLIATITVLVVRANSGCLFINPSV